MGYCALRWTKEGCDELTNGKFGAVMPTLASPGVTGTPTLLSTTYFSVKCVVFEGR